MDLKIIDGTFTAPVAITLPSGAVQTSTMEFAVMDMNKIAESLNKTPGDCSVDIVIDWANQTGDKANDFSVDKLRKLGGYPFAYKPIIETYLARIRGEIEKN